MIGLKTNNNKKTTYKNVLHFQGFFFLYYNVFTDFGNDANFRFEHQF